MEDGIFRLLHHYHEYVLQEGWLLQKMGLFHRCWESSITAEIYLLNRWTWYMTGTKKIFTKLDL